MRVQLLGLESDHFLREGSTCIGRSRRCDITISDPRVSRQHIILHLKNDHLVAQSCGSRNAVLINGHVLGDNQALQDGDQVVLGPVVFTVACATGPAAAIDSPQQAHAANTQQSRTTPSSDRIETEEMDALPANAPDANNPQAAGPKQASAGPGSSLALTGRNSRSRINEAIADAIAESSKSHPAYTDQFAPSESMLPALPANPLVAHGSGGTSGLEPTAASSSAPRKNAEGTADADDE